MVVHIFKEQCWCICSKNNGSAYTQISSAYYTQKNNAGAYAQRTMVVHILLRTVLVHMFKLQGDINAEISGLNRLLLYSTAEFI